MKQQIITSLPLCLFDTISEYLVELVIGDDITYKENLKSWRNFCNSSKKVSEIKRYYIVYNLNNIHSVSYLTFRDEDLSFVPYSNVLEEARPAVRRILSSVESTVKQLFLYIDARGISSCWDAESTFLDDFVTTHAPYLQAVLGIKLHLYHSLKSFVTFQNLSFFEVHCQGDLPIIKSLPLLLASIKKVGLFISSFGGFQSLSLSSTDDTLPVSSDSSAKGVEVVYLSNCFMDDVTQLCSMTRNVKRISLPENPNLCDVSHFATFLPSLRNKEDVTSVGNLQFLDLSYCTSICDVSMLGTLKTLILRGCIGITDISALGHVSTLDICGIPTIEKGLPFDNTVRSLYIDRHLISEISSYQNKRLKRQLYIYGNEERVTGWLHEGYRNLMLEWNMEVQQLYHMKDLASLTLIHCSNVSTISDLPSLTQLTLESCDFRISNLDFSSLPSLKYLSLHSVSGSCLSADKIVQLHAPLQFVSLRCCYHLQMEVLTNLISLKIEKSDAITLMRNGECYTIDGGLDSYYHIDCLCIDEHSMIMMR
jgi:hypothetical protein